MATKKKATVNKLIYNVTKELLSSPDSGSTMYMLANVKEGEEYAVGQSE